MEKAVHLIRKDKELEESTLANPRFKSMKKISLKVLDTSISLYQAPTLE